jgi:GH15 family glucan-1,4-alpha-glucosidase
MAKRPIVLSNGKLHVGLNSFGTVHDFYYPYVGYENHSAGSNLRHRVGVWVDGEISWTDNPNDSNGKSEWEFTFQYPHSALIGHTVAKNNRLGIILEFDDFVDANIDAFFRNIHIVNLRDQHREIRLFMHQAFAIGDSRSNSDTAQFIPDSNAILHYRGHRAFVVSGSNGGGTFDQYSVGLFGIEGRDGTFRDAEDGMLDMNNVEHGRVDSTIRFSVNIDPLSSQRVRYWIAAGRTIRDALRTHKQIKNDSSMSNMKSTADWWNNWLKPTFKILDKIKPEHRMNFMQSVMIIKSQIDNGGAIIASTDTSMLNYSRDAYAYCWPRDGAYTIWPLMRIGYTDEPYKFFMFTKAGMHSDGYMLHKYRADGALGSSWHSYVHEGGVVAPPIQEDETALPLYMFAEYYKLHPTEELLNEFYDSMVMPMADFLANYVDNDSGLPKPSYDLWEQTFQTSTYTTAVTHAALIAASDLALAAHDQSNSVKWRTAANDIQVAAHKYLFNKKRNVFYRGVDFKNGQVVGDEIVDTSSVFGAYMYGLFAPDSEEIKASINTIQELFGINKGAIGLPRSENDDYRRVSHGIAGNHWFITSFWLAQYYLDNNDQEKAYKILDWAKDHAMNTGVMGEQLDPVTNQVIAPAPLTWTHAEYVATLLDAIAKDGK